MTADLRPDVGTIEHLDFEPTIPCEYRLHETHHDDEPAMFIVRATCAGCGFAKDFALCLSGWELFGRVPAVYCADRCNYTEYGPRETWLTILRVIGGPR